MNRCETCRHFLPMADSDDDEPYGVVDGEPVYGTEASQELIRRARTGTLREGDTAPLTVYFDGFCELAEMPDDEETPTRAPAMLASSIDGSGYRGSLLVRLDFGCVCWQEKLPA